MIPWTLAVPGSSVLGILQARILEWVDIPFSRGSSRPGEQICVSRFADRFFLYHLRQKGSFNLYVNIFQGLDRILVIEFRNIIQKMQIRDRQNHRNMCIIG